MQPLQRSHPGLYREIHPQQQTPINLEDLTAKSAVRLRWQCYRHAEHEWLEAVNKRVRDSVCPYCRLQWWKPEKNLYRLHPEIASEWHPSRNGMLTPMHVAPTCRLSFWWSCERGHDWACSVEARVRHGRRCPECAKIDASGLAPLLGSLEALSEAELYIVAMQLGVTPKKARSWLVRAGRLSMVALCDDDGEEDEGETPYAKRRQRDAESTPNVEEIPGPPAFVLDHLTHCRVDDAPIGRAEMQAVGDALEALRILAPRKMDPIVWAYLINRAVDRIWQEAERLGPGVLAALRAQRGSGYVQEVSARVEAERLALLNYQIPQGFVLIHKKTGRPYLPYLSQKLAAIRLRRLRRLGNYSAPGGGKTLAGLLAAAAIDAPGMTVIVCPNSVVDRWKEAIEAIHPGATFLLRQLPQADALPDYLVLNVEWFQRRTADEDAAALAMLPIRCLIFDEAHLLKVRRGGEEQDLARRRVNTMKLRQVAEEWSPRMGVLTLTGTPAVNTLAEAQSLLELLHGKPCEERVERTTVEGALRVHWELMASGMRWAVKSEPGYRPPSVCLDELDASPVAECLFELANRRGEPAHPAEVDRALLPVKLPVICAAARPGTIVYTQFVEGIVEPLVAALRGVGWRVGIFTGEDHSGLSPFLEGRLDVLVASSTLEVGIDGLQNVADQMIFAGLPWTDASYRQIVARLDRPGQEHQVTVRIPLTQLPLGDDTWSWDAQRWDLIARKRTLADAVTDGVFPDGQLASPRGLTQSLLGWLLQFGARDVTVAPELLRPFADEVTETSLRHSA